MIGFYDYTVWLTYISLMSGAAGIFAAVNGHIYPAAFFLLFSGLCDAFDGKVARTKKNRTEMQKIYGIELDSLADIVAFGCLPVAIGYSLLVSFYGGKLKMSVFVVTILLVLMVYVLAALIRLAYYNATEYARTKEETGDRKEYSGLPVTSAALVYPLIILINSVSKVDITVAYFAVMFLMAVAFILPIKVKKPSLKGVIAMVIIGVVEFLIIFLKGFVI